MPERKTSKKPATNRLPHNIDAEKAVLGACFLTKEACLDVLDSLDEKDFYLGKHQILYRVINKIANEMKNVDVLTVIEELLKIKELENVGGSDYIKECTDSIVAISALRHYIEIVSKESTLRKLILSIRDIDDKYRTEEVEDIDDFISASENKIKEALENRRVSRFLNVGDVAIKVGENIATMQEHGKEGLVGVTTGYNNLNKYTQGFKKGEVIIVAARPNVGKTMLCLNFAIRVSQMGKKPVGIFSIEMSEEDLARRLIGITSMVELGKIATGNLSGQERAKINVAIKELGDSKIFIDSTPGIKMNDIVTRSRQLQAAVPDLGMICIDYLGLITNPSFNKGGADSRQEEVRKISLQLKQLARELNIPIVVVSQLSRDVEKRDSKRPMMSDLRDSGSIEQDADIIMLLYRDDYYSQNVSNAGNKKGGQLSNQEKFDLAREKRASELANQIPGNASYVEVNVAKNRNGSTGRCPLFFYRDFGLFEEPSQQWIDEMKNITGDVE